MAQEMSLSGSSTASAAVSESVKRYRQMINVEEDERVLSEASTAAPLSTPAMSPRENYLPDYLYPLVIREGSILQHELWKDTAVCVIANASGTTAYATSGVLERKYEYADYYRAKRRMYTTTRAITADRSATGVASVRQGDGGPVIIYLIAHFGPGKPLEHNEIAMKQLRSSTDKHYVNGLARDGLENRMRNMDECLNSLFNELQKLDCREIVFPVEVEGGSWSHAYITLLQGFAARCMPLKIIVSLLCASPLLLPRPEKEKKQRMRHEMMMMMMVAVMKEEGEITRERRRLRSPMEDERVSKRSKHLENDH
ncbi:uncharacterized protein LOC119576264 [Penaeus monodon]|uniref:uncharacterized protein LOC119576264 n=1 Tax=Penaeus monodon TaxID=6687 RepID=UPI0018A7700C|nr:uncharacterized protein LOC119576264 [Penaeus monodon]